MNPIDLYTKVQIETHKLNGNRDMNRQIIELSHEMEALIGVIAKYLPEMQRQDKQA